jgi:hypothetical protein
MAGDFRKAREFESAVDDVAQTLLLRWLRARGPIAADDVDTWSEERFARMCSDAVKKALMDQLGFRTLGPGPDPRSLAGVGASATGVSPPRPTRAGRVLGGAEGEAAIAGSAADDEDPEASTVRQDAVARREALLAALMGRFGTDEGVPSAGPDGKVRSKARRAQVLKFHQGWSADLAELRAIVGSGRTISAWARECHPTLSEVEQRAIASTRTRAYGRAREQFLAVFDGPEGTLFLDDVTMDERRALREWFDDVHRLKDESPSDSRLPGRLPGEDDTP